MSAGTDNRVDPEPAFPVDSSPATKLLPTVLSLAFAIGCVITAVCAAIIEFAVFPALRAEDFVTFAIQEATPRPWTFASDRYRPAS